MLIHASEVVEVELLSDCRHRPLTNSLHSAVESSSSLDFEAFCQSENDGSSTEIIYLIIIGSWKYF